MNRLLSLTLAAVVLLSIAGLLYAQQAPSQPDAEACAAACGGLMLGIIVLLTLHIILLVWVARDAKARGMDSAVLWMILVMITGLIGLVIYLFSRSEGTLVRCASCGNKRLHASAKCPHCGNV